MTTAETFSIRLSNLLSKHLQRSFRVPNVLSTVTLALQSFFLKSFSEIVNAGPKLKGLINHEKNE